VRERSPLSRHTGRARRFDIENPLVPLSLVLILAREIPPPRTGLSGAAVNVNNDVSIADAIRRGAGPKADSDSHGKKRPRDPASAASRLLNIPATRSSADASEKFIYQRAPMHALPSPLHPTTRHVISRDLGAGSADDPGIHGKGNWERTAEKVRV